MKKMFKLLLLVVFCLCSPLAAMSSAQEPPTLDMAGLTAMLEKNRGKVIMLNFFATWCPPCRVEIPELAKLRKDYPESEFLLLGLSVDENKSLVEPFAKEAGVNYPIFMATRDITDSLDISSVPHNTFFTRDGRMIISEPGMAEVAVLKDAVNNLLNTKQQ